MLMVAATGLLVPYERLIRWFDFLESLRVPQEIILDVF